MNEDLTGNGRCWARATGPGWRSGTLKTHREGEPARGEADLGPNADSTLGRGILGIFFKTC